MSFGKKDEEEGVFWQSHEINIFPFQYREEAAISCEKNTN